MLNQKCENIRKLEILEIISILFFAKIFITDLLTNY